MGWLAWYLKWFGEKWIIIYIYITFALSLFVCIFFFQGKSEFSNDSKIREIRWVVCRQTSNGRNNIFYNLMSFMRCTKKCKTIVTFERKNLPVQVIILCICGPEFEFCKRLLVVWSSYSTVSTRVCEDSPTSSTMLKSESISHLKIE